MVVMIGQRGLHDLLDSVALPDQVARWAMIMRNIVMAVLCSGTGMAMDALAIS